MSDLAAICDRCHGEVPDGAGYLCVRYEDIRRHDSEQAAWAELHPGSAHDLGELLSLPCRCNAPRALRGPIPRPDPACRGPETDRRQQACLRRGCSERLLGCGYRTAIRRSIAHGCLQ